MTRHKTDSEVIYRSNVRVTVLPGAIKSVSLPAESAPIRMGLHGALAEHYKLSAATFEPCASTLDYVVGATAGCLMGTLGRTLAGYKVPTTGGRLQLEAEGQIEIEEGVLVIRRILVVAHLQAEESHRVSAERAVAEYSARCPVYRSLYKAIDITTELDFQPVGKFLKVDLKTPPAKEAGLGQPIQDHP